MLLGSTKQNSRRASVYVTRDYIQELGCPYLKDLSTFSFAKEVKQYLLFKQCSQELRKSILNQYYQTYALLTGSSLFLLVAPYLFLLKLTVNSY